MSSMRVLVKAVVAVACHGESGAGGHGGGPTLFGNLATDHIRLVTTTGCNNMPMSRGTQAFGRYRQRRSAIAARALLALSLLVLSLPAAAQVSGILQLAVPEPLEEIEVNAQREKLSVLQAELFRAEDAFYAEYNRLNRKDRFDVDCMEYARTGTRFKTRDCRPVFVNDATSLESRQIGDTSFGVGQAPSSIVISEMWPRFEAHLLAVINSSTRLKQLLRERAQIAQRIEALRRAKHATRVVVAD